MIWITWIFQLSYADRLINRPISFMQLNLTVKRNQITAKGSNHLSDVIVGLCNNVAVF